MIFVGKAHDRLHAIINGEIDLGIPPGVVLQMRTTVTALCWVLGCPAGHVLTETFANIDAAAEERGLVFRSVAVPLKGRPGRG